MSQLVHAIKGIGEACQALDFPIVSRQRLSLQRDKRQAIRRPYHRGVGLVRDWSKIGRGFALLGERDHPLAGAPQSWGTHIGQSVYMRDIHGRTDVRAAFDLGMNARSAISFAG